MVAGAKAEQIRIVESHEVSEDGRRMSHSCYETIETRTETWVWGGQRQHISTQDVDGDDRNIYRQRAHVKTGNKSR